jgi:hypothetical protein
MQEHEFTQVIKKVLWEEFGGESEKIYQNSELLQYINVKTASASKGSKARGSFGNIYAIYVLVEDYLNRGFHVTGNYEDAEGARFSDLLKRQRELPFGRKLQNHALNHRLNQEFERYFPLANAHPVLRDPETRQYWINENLLIINIDKLNYNLAEATLRIITTYVDARQEAFKAFISDCERMVQISNEDPDSVIEFIANLLRPNVDARIFEIVSFAILKANYGDRSIFWGWELDRIERENLILYKTGRTNANDGGIDFVMRPLGRFFQVTETLDVTKYFLDIDKVQKYPITFVVKTELDISNVEKIIKTQAEEKYPVKAIVNRYMGSIEEIINIPILVERFFDVVEQGNIPVVIDEIVKHSKVEFNIPE